MTEAKIKAEFHKSKPTWLKSGWRIALGWLTPIIIFNLYILYPLFKIKVDPVLYNHILELILISGAMGGLRSFEKYKGITK